MTEQLSVSRLLACIENTTEINSVLLLDREGAVAADSDGRITIERSSAVDAFPSRVFDLVIVVDEIEHRNAQSAAELLGGLRNRRAPRLLLVCKRARSPLDPNALRALGFQPLAESEQGLSLFYYDIDAYNERREWDNPADWAHPDNFDRDRW